MSDECDQANDIRDLELAHALANRKLPPMGAGTPDCQECGNDIPETRQALGYTVCLACAEVRERRSRVSR